MQSSLERLRRRRSEVQGEGGFTLIELLIVIVILGILAAIVVFAVQNLSSTSAQSSCKSDFKTVETAMEAYKAQMGNYPSGSADTAGATPNTDSDSGTAPLAATALTAAIAPSGVNAAASSSGTAAGDELLTGGASYTGGTKNTAGSASLGPWLKDVPSNSGHYAIWAANDGSGHVLIVNSSGDAVSSAGDASGTVTYTAADCAGIS